MANNVRLIRFPGHQAHLHGWKDYGVMKMGRTGLNLDSVWSAATTNRN